MADPKPIVGYSTEALSANLNNLEREWDTYQSRRDRDAVYGYLNAVFELVMWWKKEGRAINRASWALRARRLSSVTQPEPFAAVIQCTADRKKVDYRTRSKWSRVLRYAAAYKDLDEPLAEFVRRKGGINKCAARFARRLGRASVGQNGKTSGGSVRGNQDKSEAGRQLVKLMT